MAFKLRPYQTNAIDEIARLVGTGKRKIVFQLATGGGKSFTFAGLADRFIKRMHKRCVLFVHREELLAQARKTFFNGFEIVSTAVTADTKYLPNSMVYSAMVETAYNRLKKKKNYFGDVGLVIIDETHLGNFRKLHDFFPDAIVVGFTATPISAKKEFPLNSQFEEIVCGIDIPDLIKMNEANPAEGLVPNITYDIQNIEREKLKIKNGEFDETEMGRLFSVEGRIDNCLKQYERYCLGKKTIVFNCNIEHSKKMNEAFLAAGYKSRHLDGETDTWYRRKTLEWFRDTPDAILNNVGILTAGFDEPSILCGIINRSVISLTLWLQMVGRMARPFPGKKNFICLDMGGNAAALGDWNVPRDWKKIFHTPEKAVVGKGESPSKACKKCRKVIHASFKTCPHCGADVQKEKITEHSFLQFKTLAHKYPFRCDVKAMIDEYAGKLKKDGTPYKEMAVLFMIRMQLLSHAKRIWKLKRIDEETAYNVLEIYQKFYKEWCTDKGQLFDWKHQMRSKQWLFEGLKQTFKWEPIGESSKQKVA